MPAVGLHTARYFASPFVWAHSEYTPQQTMRGKMALYGTCTASTTVRAQVAQEVPAVAAAPAVVTV
jgi:hypothetical protein